MALEIKGKVIKRLDQFTGEGKNGTWKKREFVVEHGDEYPKITCFEVWNDKVDIVDSFVENQEVKVSFRAESREYQGRYYTSLTAYKIETNGATNSAPPAKETKQAAPPAEEEDNLPF